jgi:hypothetical protein
VLDVPFCQCDPHQSFVRRPADATTLAQAELRLLVHLGLGDDPASRGIRPDEVDAGCLADQAAPAVAPDEELGPQ